MHGYATNRLVIKDSFQDRPSSRGREWNQTADTTQNHGVRGVVSDDPQEIPVVAQMLIVGNFCDPSLHFTRHHLRASASMAVSHARRRQVPRRHGVSLVRKAHDECQCNIQSRNILVIQATDPAVNAFATHGNRFVRHHPRAHSQSVLAGTSKLQCSRCPRTSNGDLAAIESRAPLPDLSRPGIFVPTSAAGIQRVRRRYSGPA